VPEQNKIISPIHDVIADFRAGRMVIIVDDESRENEGDIAIATEMVTPESLAFMMTEARGLICVSISQDVAERLKLFPQVDTNNSRYGTPFTSTVDHSSVVSESATATARAFTMQRLIAEDAKPNEFVTPGQVFPLVAHPRGVLGRRGQTEGSFDLARLAGLKPSGIICEVLNPDGTMARGRDLISFAERHNLKIVSVEAITKHIVTFETFVREVAREKKLTDYGEFLVSVFESDVDNREHLALQYGDLFGSSEPPLVRIHSECLTGDVFSSRRCDCGSQLAEAMDKIVENGSGVVLYLRQEGRGIGLLNKLRAYELQDKGKDTVEANLELGFEADARDFAVAAKILLDLGIKELRLMTNNPKKVETLESFGIEVVERVPIIQPSDEYNSRYLETKRTKLGHIL